LSRAPEGLIQFEIGIQSTNEKTLKAIARNMPLEKAFDNIRRLIAMKNIHIHLDLIAGLPYESLELFKKSFNDTYRLKPHQLQLGFLKLLKGSPLEEMTEVHGYCFSKNPPYEIIYNKYISSREIFYLKQFEDCFNRFYNSGRFGKTLEYLEAFYNSPFEMFEDISTYMEKYNMTYKALSSRSLYDFLAALGEEKKGTIDRDTLKEKLLFDFYSTDKSDTVPASLRDIADFSREARATIRMLMNDMDIPKGSCYAGRFINGSCYIFDYSAKNPVSGLYPLVKKIEK